MAGQVKRRQSIHQDKKTKEDKQECKECGKWFELGNHGTKKELDKKNYQNIPRKRLYPSLEEDNHFTCSDCAKEENPEIQSVPNQKASVQTQPIKNKDWLVKNKSLKFWGIMTMLVIIFIFVLNLTSKETERVRATRKSFDYNMPKQSAREEKFDNELEQLENTYKRQHEDVWSILASGIKSVLRKNPNQPSVFLMLFEEDSAGKTATCLAKEVSVVATRYIMNRPNTPLIYSAQDFESDELKRDPGKIIEYLKDPIEKKGVLIVTDLQDVSPDIAKQFHFFCDKYSPVVEKSIYFFTLKVNQFSSSKLQEVAEGKLKELWSHVMPDNYLNPLITRLTPNILEISSDYSGC